MNTYWVLALAIIFNALANILIKIGMTKLPKNLDLLQMISKAIFLPSILLGIICFVLALITYGYILSKVNLSIAIPS